jgi:hypothetical protein
MKPIGDPVPELPSTPKECQSCGAKFERSSVVAGRRFYHSCPRCDMHGWGCVDRTHPPGKCICTTYPPDERMDGPHTPTSRV